MISVPTRLFGRIAGTGLLAVTLACSPVPATPAAPSAPSVPTQPAQTTTSVTDVIGRSVSVKTPVRRVILGEARQLYLIAMLDTDNPFQRIVGWPNDLKTADPETYEKYRAKFPKMTEIPIFGSPQTADFSVEKAIDLKPDLLILNLDAYQGAQDAGVIEKLAQVGIPSIVIDFRQQPLENTIPSMLLLGRVFGKETRTNEFIDYYQQQINTVTSRLAGITAPKPKVFLYRAAGLSECCATFGRGNLGVFVERAGGENLGSSLLPGWQGTLNPEQVITSNPDVIIATGANWKNLSNEGGFISLGYLSNAGQAREQLRDVIARQHWETLAASRTGRVHAIWHQFYNSPYHFVALQQFAKWIYPDTFRDLNPDKTFDEFHRKFLPIDYSGTFWASLAN